MPRIKRIILYYPTINVPSNSWLRHALLYWDQVSSIVPRNVRDEVELSDDIRMLMDEGQFVPVRPDQLTMSENGFEYLRQFEEEFIAVVRSNTYKKYLKKRKSLRFSRMKDEKLNPFMAKTDHLRTSRVHSNKTTNRIHDFLVDQKLAKNKIEEGWYSFESNTALLYMSLLAKYLAAAADNPTIVGTDYVVFENFNFAPIMNNEVAPVLDINIRNLLPTPHSGTSLKKIVAFKKKRIDNLLHFRKLLWDFQSNVSKSKSQEELRETAMQFSETISLGISDLAATLKDARIAAAWKSIKSMSNWKSATLRTGLAEIANEALSIIDVNLLVKVGALIVPGVIEIGSQYVEFRNDVRSRYRGSPFAYLYEAQQRGILKKNLT